MQVFARPAARIILLFVAFFTIAHPVIAQNTIHVPADQPSIQLAIQAANDGDIILVSPGTYFEHLNFTGRAITVASTDGPAVTIIDGFSSGTVVQFQNGDTSRTVLRGFTITNGFGFNGGGIFANFSSPTIENNIISGNQGCEGVGIMLQGSNAIVRHNTITNNSDAACSGGEGGGGIEIDGQSSAQILNNTITSNHAFTGGGIHVFAFSGTPIISANTIQNNVTDSDGGGILSDAGSGVTISDNLVTGNTAANNGGGINIVPGTSATAVNNTVAANTAALGSQLYLDGFAGIVQLANNILYDLTGNGAIYCSYTGGTVFPNWDSNDAVSLPSNSPGTLNPPYTGSCSDITGFNGNIQKDPLFVDAANNDFHLAPGSPAIDAGDSFSNVNLPALDLDGNPRIGAGDLSCRAAVDMGAYEFVFLTDGSAVLSSSNLFFGNQLIGAQPSPQSILLTGTQGCAQISSIATTGDYTQTSSCSVLQPGNSCTIQVSFNPTAPGFREGSLVVNLRSTVPAAPVTASLTGQAQNAGQVSPTNINFGNQLLQTTSASQFVLVTAGPVGPLVTNSVTITGDFAQTNFCTGPFSGGNCSVNVTFTPTQAGARTGTLTINTNQGVYTVPLIGNGAAPVPDFTPASMVFPSQTIGTISAEQTATLTNDGSADLFVNGGIVNGPFALTGNDCLSPVAPGASCHFRLTFNPAIIGDVTGQLVVNTNGGSATLNLSGTGTAPIASLAPQSLTFVMPVNTFSPAQTVLLTNISGLPLQLNSFSAPDGFLANTSCPQVLDPNASCSISIILVPIATAHGGFLSVATNLGTVTATLTIADGHRTIRVPADAPSIFAAVQLAQDGDVIQVAPGTYFEQVNFQGKAITIASTSGAAATIIDGQGFNIPVFIDQGEGPKSILRGFTITHGSPIGMLIDFSSPTIEDNIISNNGNSCGGAGINALGSAALIRNNIISNNTMNPFCSGDGGGVLISGFSGADLRLLNNTITGNQASSNGGGIAVEGPATLTGNIVQNNSAGGNGGGIYIATSATLTNNLVTGNTSLQNGGGIYAPGAQGLTLLNNTVADNAAGFSVGGVFVGGGAQIFNNIILDSTGGGALACVFGQLPNLGFNDVIGIPGQPNTAYTMGCSDQTGISGSIQQDPQFVNQQGGDYHLQSTSPAIDAGVELAGIMPETDLEGKPRVEPGNGSCSGRVDLGPYEFLLTSSGTVFPLPSSLDFGSMTLGNSGFLSVNVSVSGCVPFSAKTTGDFQQTNPCNGAIGGTNLGCSIQVTFTPTALGTRTGTLTLDFGGVSPTQTITLTGKGVGIPPSASPSSLNFGSVNVQTSTAPQTVKITGQLFSLPLIVNGIWVTGDFSTNNFCAGNPATFDPESCTINVVFTPTAGGPRTGLLTVSTNQGTVTVPLTGSGAGSAAATLSPTTIAFGNQLVNTLSPGQLATVTNNGTAPLSLGSFTISPSFAIDPSRCQTTLNPGLSCSYIIFFEPSAIGPVTGVFTLPTSAGTLTVNLSGTGVAPVLSITPSSLTFGAQTVQTTSSAQTINLSNTGTAPLSFGTIASSSEFPQTNTCVTTLNPGASCTISVTFKPAATGVRTGSITIPSSSGSLAVSVSGTGANATAGISPTALAFSGQIVNSTSRSQPITLTAGVNPLQISAIAAVGDFSQTNTCGATLSPAASCSIQVSFAPTVAGARTGTLTITSSEGQLSASLSGTGLPRAANTIYVPADQPTIQAAITAAPAGTSVVVLPGTYVENIDFQGKAITVSSSDGPSVTTIDGGGVGPVATFLSGEGTGSVLSGFTLQHGVPSNVFPIGGTSGGGVLIMNASPTITNNVITNNHAICGIGMEIRNGSPMVRGNTFTGNTQAGGTGGCGGGGIEVTGDSSHPASAPQIIGNTITNNSLLGGGDGGGIEVSGFAAPLIQDNVISGNAVFNNGGGVDLDSSIAGTVLVQNIIVNNSAGGGGSGGGVSVASLAQPPVTVANNTIAGNTASDKSSGIFADRFPSVLISNNIVVAAPGQTGITCSSLSSSFPTFSHNDVTSSAGGLTWSTNCASNAATNGNISADPQFVSAAAGNYHVQTGSPVIDAGDNAAPNLPPLDFDGNARISIGSATTCTSTIDMGAYEFRLTTQPSATLAPATLDFGGVLVGTASASQTVTFTAAQGCVAKPAITVSGDYQETDNCSSVLGTGASCTIQVTFAPTATGTRAGSLAVASGTSSFSTSLTGQGQTVIATVSATTLDFGNQLVGTTSAARTITLTSSGTLAVQISGITASGDFAQSNNCPASLAPQTSCTISVSFTPTVTGARAGTLNIAGNGGAPQVSLSGVGTIPNPVFSTGSIGYGNVRVGTAATQSLTLSNTGTADFVNNGLSISGAAEFTQTSNCPTTLAPGASCTINVSFSPVARGSRSATLAVSTTQAVSTPTAALSGTGVAPVAALTSSLAFAAQIVGSTTNQTATLSNPGDAPLNISAITASGDFAQSNTCGTSLAAGASCSITLSFTPTAAGARSGSLTVSDDSLGSAQQTTALSGTGLDYAVSASPAALTIRTGKTGQTTITVSALGGSFGNTVGLSCANLPAGTTCSFSPTSVVPGATSASSSLTINTQQSGGIKASPGTYNITVSGTSSGLVHSTVITLTVTR